MTALAAWNEAGERARKERHDEIWRQHRHGEETGQGIGEKQEEGGHRRCDKKVNRRRGPNLF